MVSKSLSTIRPTFNELRQGKPEAAGLRNTEHVDRLIAEGRMEEPGLAQVKAAKVDGRWEDAYPPPSEAEVPADFVAALESKPKAKRFQTLNKSSQVCHYV